jgi:DNA-binding transcriptional LysR family regulator
MTIKQLRIFSATARYGNLTKASHELRISQPAVSKQLKLLEEEYRTKLFIRVGRGVELTDAGRAFLHNADAILTPLERLKKDLSFSQPISKNEPLAIGGSHGASAVFLPSVLGTFRKSHPDVSVILRTNRSRALENLLLKSRLEIALISQPPRSSFLKAEPYRRQKLVAFVPMKHPLAKKRQLSAPELFRYPLVLNGGGRERISTSEKFLTEIPGGSKPNVVMRCESPLAVKTAVRNGMGVGILFEDIVQHEVKEGQFKILKLPATRLESTTYLIYHKDRPLSANARDFLNLLEQWRQVSSTRPAPDALEN